jgi:hypothetical protein
MDIGKLLTMFNSYVSLPEGSDDEILAPGNFMGLGTKK